MFDYLISFMVGLLAGLATRRKEKDWEEQKKMYDARLQEQANTIDYYKRLCKWHVEQRGKNERA